MSERINHNPDVLSCLANLSNDEVFTPPEVANAMLDMIPKELFEDPNSKFLDPACKTGVFLREIAKRLLKGLEDIIPNLQERIDHIFQKQLFAIAITELTSLVSRRSLYCSKAANGIYSISSLKNGEGNVHFERIEHSWNGDKCIYCGTPRKTLDRGSEYETYAYEFIHSSKIIKDFIDMKFDLIISNPPYQLSDGGAQASALPIYQKFVEQAKKLRPRYLSMIIPARWYAGGKGLDDFRQQMLSDKFLVSIDDFTITEDCFPGVNIRGGVCYFLWERNHDNKNQIKVTTHDKDSKQILYRPLKYNDLDIFIRNGKSLSVIEKITKSKDFKPFSELVSSLRPFGLRGYFTQDEKFRETANGLKKPIKCYGKGKQIGYVEYNEIAKNKEWIERWKLFMPRANNIGTELPDDNLNSFVGEPRTICTESYLALGANQNYSKNECENISLFLKTRFARFAHSVAKSSQDATAKTFRFVPFLDFSLPWTDEELFKKYDLDDQEIAFINSMIRPMDVGGLDE